jgi:hypothetical protein
MIRRIVSTSTVSLPIGDSGSDGVTFAPPYPSPAGARVEFDYSLAREGRVTLAIHDVHGRLVRALVGARTESAGRHHATWDGLDREGHAVRSGLYFGRLTVDGRSRERRVIVLR